MTRNLFKRSGPLLGIIAVALIWVASAATSADAVVAAGTSIDNEATVSYNEGADETSNTVSTTVNLVSVLEWDDASLNLVTQTTGSLSALPGAYTVDLVNLGNGATTATIVNGTTQSDPALTAGTWTINGTAATTTTGPAVALGGTVSSSAGVINASSNTDITISNGLVAGLTAGDTVRIGATNYVVESITATTLEVQGDATGDVAAGVQIGEVSTITFTGTTGALTGATTRLHLHSMTANDETIFGGGSNSSGNTSATDTVSSNSDGGGGTAWETLVQAGVLTIQKYVRNATPATTHNPAAGSGFTYGGFEYWLSGVTGDSGTDTLEYLIVVSNAGPGSATDVTVTDIVSNFLTVTTTSVDIDTNGDETFDLLNTINAATPAATFDVPTLTLAAYAGEGGVAATFTGGIIFAPDAVGPPIKTGISAVRFQADIN